LESIRGLESLIHLRFLVISHNQLRDPIDLVLFKRLILLDLSHNCIQGPLKHIRLPTELIFLDLSGNPCVNQLSDPEINHTLAKMCPNLEEINGKPMVFLSNEFQDRADDDSDMVAYIEYARSVTTPSPEPEERAFDGVQSTPREKSEILQVRAFGEAPISAGNQFSENRNEYEKRIADLKQKYGYSS
jgi:hypothetical protein